MRRLGLSPHRCLPKIQRPRRTPRHADWGIGLTVCVAAFCETSRTIVTASDRLLTWGHTSSESALKLVQLHNPHWLAMIAGEDITVGVESVAANVRETLTAMQPSQTAQQVQAVLLGAWRDARNQIAEATVLAPYRLNVQTFVQQGRKYFGDAKFLDLATQLEHSTRLKCDLLVCGFDDKHRPTLFVCDDESGCRNFTRAGFVAIGSGDVEALASMSFHRYDTMCSLDQAIYRVCAAKFMAEKAIGVGTDTMVLCMRNDGRTKWIFQTAVEPIRRLWESEGQPRVPSGQLVSNALERVNQELDWLD